MIGIISAFGAAISWTYACFIWRTQTAKYKSIDINLLKNIIASLIFLPSLINFSYSIELKSMLFLLLSGVIGIGLGDTFYIKSLQLIGTRKTLSLETLSPIIAAFLGTIFINENLTIKSWIGIFIVSISLYILLRKKTDFLEKTSPYLGKTNLKTHLFPLLSVLCAVLGGLLTRVVFLESKISPLHSTEIRLLGAIFFLVCLKKFRINLYLRELDKNQKKRFLLSIFLGTNIGIFLQQIVFKTLPLGIGWSLLSTSPVISLIFAKREEKEITKEIILFTGLLFMGISLIIL